MQLAFSKHGGMNQKIQTKKCAQNMGVSHEKNWEKKPHLPFQMKQGGVRGFSTLVLTKLVALKRDKKLKVSEVRNCNAN
jgi:hypothetical protein